MALGKVSTRLAAAVSGVDEVVSLGGLEAAIEARKSRSGSVEAILLVYDEGEVRLSCVQSFIQCTETFLKVSRRRTDQIICISQNTKG